MDESLRIVFMGSPDFAVPTLEKLHESKHTIVSVISGSDKRRKRRGEPEPTPVKRRALELGLDTFEADDMQDPLLQAHLKKLTPDLFVVVAFKILPPSLLHIPGKGSVNLHASLLPKYRGAAPIHWAVINGEVETGCTVFFLDRGVDTGKIIKQKTIPVGPDETTGELYDRLKALGAGVMMDGVNEIAAGTAKPLPQDESKATGAPKLFRGNTRIDFEKPALDVHNFIRGLNPFPVAWCMYGKDKMNIYRAKPLPKDNLKPGELHEEDGKLFAGTGKGSIEILELQLPGTRRMDGSDFVNGYSLETELT